MFTNENMFKFIVISFIIYFLFKINSEKFTEGFSDDIKDLLFANYKMDVGSLRTLSAIADNLYNTSCLTIPSNAKLRNTITTNNKELTTPNHPTTSQPLIGIKTPGIWLEGNLGCGASTGAVKSSINNTGQIK